MKTAPQFTAHEGGHFHTADLGRFEGHVRFFPRVEERPAYWQATLWKVRRNVEGDEALDFIEASNHESIVDAETWLIVLAEQSNQFYLNHGA